MLQLGGSGWGGGVVRELGPVRGREGEWVVGEVLRLGRVLYPMAVPRPIGRRMDAAGLAKTP